MAFATSSFLLLVVMPGARSSVFAPSSLSYSLTCSPCLPAALWIFLLVYTDLPLFCHSLVAEILSDFGR